MQMAKHPSSREIMQVAELFRKGCESLNQKAAEKCREVLEFVWVFFLNPSPRWLLSLLLSKLRLDLALSHGWGDAHELACPAFFIPDAVLSLSSPPT